MTYANDRAMPLAYEEEVGDYGHKMLVTQPGLTKREYFAAMAMQGMIGYPSGHVDGYSDDIKCAELSVRYADALINELNKQP